MWEQLIKRTEKLGEKYFKRRSNQKLIRALDSQVRSMYRNPSSTNIHKQAGDLQFLLVELARNNGWDPVELLKDRVDELEQRMRERHYYEAHVTIEPVYEERLVELKKIAKDFDFHVATLEMKKRAKATPTRSENDSFCTARGVSYSDLEDRTEGFAEALKEAGFKVWRCKIESTVVDSRYAHSRFPLDAESLPEKERNPRAPADGALAGRVE